MRQSKTSKKYAKAPRNDGTPDKEVTVRIRGGSVAISQKDSVILTRGLRLGGENQRPSIWRKAGVVVCQWDPQRV